MSKQYKQAISQLSGQALELLHTLPESEAEKAREVHLRAGKPIHLLSENGHLFLGRNGQIFRSFRQDLPALSQRTLEDCFLSLCDYSIHTHMQDIVQGFVTLQGGHRAGIAGNCVTEQGKVVGMRDVSSICLRIARDFPGCAKKLTEIVEKTHGGLLVAGIPGSGKTTLLRDLARSLSDGSCGKYHTVAIVDERGEIAASYNGQPQLNVGICCDILTGYSKRTGIEIAVRTLAPEFVFCDELGGAEDTEAFRQSICRGVRIIATVHARNYRELITRAGMPELLDTGAFSGIVFLGSNHIPGQITEYVSLKEDDT